MIMKWGFVSRGKWGWRMEGWGWRVEVSRDAACCVRHVMLRLIAPQW